MKNKIMKCIIYTLYIISIFDIITYDFTSGILKLFLCCYFYMFTFYFACKIIKIEC